MIRLFIAVPIPPEIRKKVEKLSAELKLLRGLPKNIRFVPPENRHFTLTFLGYQPEESVPIIKNSMANLRTSDVLRLEFERLVYGPTGKTPRMIWLTATNETSRALGVLKKNIEDELEIKGIKWRRETRPYRAHLTLSRFEPTARQNLPKIEKDLDWSYEVKEIHLMRSNLKKTGAEYRIIETFNV